MAHLICSAISSLDGFKEDTDGKFDWAAPDEDVHIYINNLERAAGTYLYGRRMYERKRLQRRWERVVRHPGFHILGLLRDGGRHDHFASAWYDYWSVSEPVKH